MTRYSKLHFGNNLPMAIEISTSLKDYYEKTNRGKKILDLLVDNYDFLFKKIKEKEDSLLNKDSYNYYSRHIVKLSGLNKNVEMVMHTSELENREYRTIVSLDIRTSYSVILLSAVEQEIFERFILKKKEKNEKS